MQLTGAIYGVVPPSREALKPVGEWNMIHITAKGRQITVELNGVKTVDANLDDYHEAAEKDHPGLKRHQGAFGVAEPQQPGGVPECVCKRVTIRGSELLASGGRQPLILPSVTDRMLNQGADAPRSPGREGHLVY